MLGRNTRTAIEPHCDDRDLVTLVDLTVELPIRIAVELLTLLDDEGAVEELMEIATRLNRRPVGGGDPRAA